MLHHQERPKRQFLMEFDTITELIAGTKLKNPEQRRYLANIRQNLETMKSTFLRLVSNYERWGFMENFPLQKEAEERLAGQILIRSRDSVANALRLKNLIDDEIATTQRRVSEFVLFLVACTTLPLAILLLRITRNIATSFADLSRGAQSIADGNLNHRIGLNTRDEIGELAAGFDLMAEKLGQITVSRDELLAEIEERKSAQEALKIAMKLAEQQRAELEAAFSSMNDGICIGNKEGEIIDFNEAFARFYRFESETECFRHFRDYTGVLQFSSLQGEELSPEMWPLPRALRGEAEINSEYIIKRTDIGEKWFAEYSFSPIRNKEGDITGAVVAMRDITERRQAEQSLRESETRYRSLFDNMAEGFALHEIITGPDGKPLDYRFLEVNPAFENLTGLSRETVIGRTARELIPGVEEFWIEIYGSVALEGTPVHAENYAAPLNRWYEVFAYRTAPRQFAVVFADITDRKRAERALRTSRDRLELLATVAERLLRAEDPQAIVEELCRSVMAHIDCQFFFNYLVDEPGRNMRLNACAGIPKEEAAAIRHLDFGVAVCGCVARDGERIITEDIQHSDDIRTQLVKSFGVQAYCCHPLEAQGKVIGTLSFGTKTRPKFTDDEVALMKSVADQVAVAMERLQASRALQESETRYRELVENANSAIIRWKGNGEIAYFNEYAQSFFGYGEEEAVGRNINILVPEMESTGADLTGLIMDIVKRPEEYLSYVNENIRRNGSRVWMTWTNKPVFDEQGRVTEILAIGSDITELKRAEEEISRKNRTLSAANRILAFGLSPRTEEELGLSCLEVLEEVTASTISFIGEIGEDGCLQDIAISNPGWDACRMMNEQGHRRPPGNFPIHGIYGRVLKDGKAFFTNDPASHPASIGLPEGHPPLENFLGVPLFRAGKVAGMIAVGNRPEGYTQAKVEMLETLAPIIVEAFDRMRAEGALHQLTKDLERRVEQRTAELSAAVRELEAFSYSVSHDLRAPLRSIDGFSRILQDKYLDRLDERGHDYLSRICNSAQKMGSLIDDLLKLSRIGRVPINRTRVDLGEVAESIAGELRQSDPGRRVQVEVAPGLKVFGDPNLLRIALENLIGNAWKFTGKVENGRITVGKKEVNGQSAFFVKDNGAGFEMAYVSKLFEPFQRLHAMEEFPGSGIGLTIVKRIIARHGGEVWAESAEGKGAAIYFTIGGNN